jgi:hypothetical protein
MKDTTTVGRIQIIPEGRNDRVRVGCVGYRIVAEIATNRAEGQIAVRPDRNTCFRLPVKIESKGQRDIDGGIRRPCSAVCQPTRCRGAYGKTAVFGIFERAGQVYTEVVSDCSKATLQGIIRGRVDPASVVNSDGWRGYNGRLDELLPWNCATTSI